MMKKYVYSFVVLFISITACQKPISKEAIKKINGYWEISKVINDKGDQKDYKVNNSVDFWSVNKGKGFKQKLMPQWDGKFETNDLRETIQIQEVSGNWDIQYHTEFGHWKEQILELTDSTLVIKNESNLTYYYKRFKPNSFTHHGQTH